MDHHLQALNTFSRAGQKPEWTLAFDIQVPMLILWLWRRYTSYGRHFTQGGHLQALNKFLLPYIRDGDTIVDFSCGANVWGPMLKTACLQQGIVSPVAPHSCQPCEHLSH